MKHGYRHLQGVRLCELPGCMLKWPCERHGARVAWATPHQFPRAIKVRSTEFPHEDVSRDEASYGCSIGTVTDKKCVFCGYHVCRQDCRRPQVTWQRTSTKRP